MLGSARQLSSIMMLRHSTRLLVRVLVPCLPGGRKLPGTYQAQCAAGGCF